MLCVILICINSIQKINVINSKKPRFAKRFGVFYCTISVTLSLPLFAV